jgi:hypothetical protein
MKSPYTSDKIRGDRCFCLPYSIAQSVALGACPTVGHFQDTLLPRRISTDLEKLIAGSLNQLNIEWIIRSPMPDARKKEVNKAKGQKDPVACTGQPKRQRETILQGLHSPPVGPFQLNPRFPRCLKGIGR